MRPISPLLSASVQLLNQSLTFQKPAKTVSPGEALLRAATGVSVPEPAPDPVRKQAETEALFAPNSLDPTAMKVDLMERLGEEFGLSMDDFQSQSAYGMAIKRHVDQLKNAGNVSEIIRIEKDLGLDELGVSLDELVEAIIEPDSDGANKLDAALKEKAGELGDEDAREALDALRLDEDGLYGFWA